MAPEVIVLLTAAAPVIEVRGSVPLGILYLHLSPLKVILLSVIGGILPLFPILWLLNVLTEGFRKIKVFDKLITSVFDHTRSKSKIIEDFELLGLTIFFAIPLPGFGIWTGAIAAYLLRLRWLPTFICAVIGTIFASLLVTAASLGIIKLIL